MSESTPTVAAAATAAAVAPPQLPPQLGRIGCPGEVACISAAAQPLLVAVDKAGPMAVVATAPLGRGRLAAIAHEGYLTNLNTDRPCLGQQQLLRCGAVVVAV